MQLVPATKHKTREFMRSLCKPPEFRFTSVSGGGGFTTCPQDTEVKLHFHTWAEAVAAAVQVEHATTKPLIIRCANPQQPWHLTYRAKWSITNTTVVYGCDVFPAEFAS